MSDLAVRLFKSTGRLLQSHAPSKRQVVTAVKATSKHTAHVLRTVLKHAFYALRWVLLLSLVALTEKEDWGAFEENRERRRGI